MTWRMRAKQERYLRGRMLGVSNASRQHRCPRGAQADSGNLQHRGCTEGRHTHRLSTAAGCQSLAAASSKPKQKGAEMSPPLTAVSLSQLASWPTPTSCMHWSTPLTYCQSYCMLGASIPYEHPWLLNIPK